MKQLQTTLMCLGMAAVAIGPAAAVAQQAPTAAPAPGASRAYMAVPRGSVGIVADPNNAYMQPTGPTPLAAKNPPNSVPGNLTPGY